jgi:hypothetical protein
MPTNSKKGTFLCREVPLNPLNEKVRGAFYAILPSMEGEVECCTLAHTPYCPEPSVVPLDDFLHRGQPNPHTGEFILLVQPLERDIQFVGIAHIKSGTVVPDEINRLPLLMHEAELDPCVLVHAGVFDGIPHKVFDTDGYQVEVGTHGYPMRHNKLNGPIGVIGKVRFC